MKPTDKKEYEALTSMEDRAKWLLRKGVTAKPDIIQATLSMTFRAVAAGAILPGEYPTAEAAIAGGTAWLAQKAGLENVQGHPCRAADGIQIDGLSASDAPSCSGLAD